MPPHEPGQVISLQTERLRRRPPAPLAKSPHVLVVASPRRDKDLRRRKVKLAVVGACLVGLLGSLLSVALESTDDEERGTMSERSERADDSDTPDSDDSPDEVSPFQPSSAEGHGGASGSAWLSAQGGGQR